MGNNVSRDSTSIDLETWKNLSRDVQEGYREFLGDRVYNDFEMPEQEEHLRKLIGVSLCGQPRQDRDDLGYSDKEKAAIAEIMEKCKKVSIDQKKVQIAIIYITVWTGKGILITPVYRVKSIGDDSLYKLAENTFIDYIGRVYNSWEHYKNENLWNGCWISAPTAAFYSLRNEICCEYWNQTRRGNSKKTLVVSVLGFASGAALLATPPSACIGLSLLIISGATSVYSAANNISKLSDKRKHQQSLLDGESGVYWMGAVFGVLAAAGNGLSILHKFVNIPMVHISTTSLGLLNVGYYSAAGLAAILLSLAEKETVSSLDVRKLQATLLFLHNLDVDYETLEGFLAWMQRHGATLNEIANSERGGFRLELNRSLRVIRDLQALLTVLFKGIGVDLSSAFSTG